MCRVFVGCRDEISIVLEHFKGRESSDATELIGKENKAEHPYQGTNETLYIYTIVFIDRNLSLKSSYFEFLHHDKWTDLPFLTD